MHNTWTDSNAVSHIQKKSITRLLVVVGVGVQTLLAKYVELRTELFFEFSIYN